MLCPGLFHLSSSIFVSSDDADAGPETGKPCGCALWQPWIYLRLVAWCFFGLSEGA